MKVLVFSSLVALSYGTAYTNSMTYIRLDMHGSGHLNAAAATGACAAAITRSFLIKPIKVGHDVTRTATHLTEWTYSMDRSGSCASFVLSTNDPDFRPQQAHNLSFALVDAGSGVYKAACYAVTDCSAAGVLDSQGFVFAPNVSGTQDCSGATGVNDDQGGLKLVTGDNQNIETTGTLFISKRAMTGQLNGPFTTSACTTLANAKTTASLPFVLPLEAATAVPAAYSEVALATSGVCFNFGTASAVHLLQAATTATGGQLVMSISSGGSAAFTNRSTCVAGSTFHKATFAATASGSFGHCVQAVDANADPVSGNYYSMQLDAASVGDWPSYPAIAAGTPGSPTACSPASALHASSFMAVLVALIAMMM